MMDFIRHEDLSYQPAVAKAVIEEADSPEKAAHLYHPAQYKMMDQVPEDAHRPVHNVLAGQTLTEQEYDLAELRKKLEKRMEYALVSNIQTDSNRQRREDEAAQASCPSFHSTPLEDESGTERTS